MDRAAAWTRNRLSRRLAEGIHRPGLSVKYGKPVPPGYWGASTWAGHGNHIHVAARRGGWLRGRGGLLVTGGGRTPSFSYTVGSGPLGRGYSGDEFGRYGQRTVGTGATLHKTVRQDLIEGDNQTLSTATHDQILTWWAEFNFGSRDLAPWAVHKTAPPENIEARGRGMTTLAAGIRDAESVAPEGKIVDRHALFEQAGIPLLDAPKEQAVTP